MKLGPGCRIWAWLTHGNHRFVQASLRHDWQFATDRARYAQDRVRDLFLADTLRHREVMAINTPNPCRFPGAVRRPAARARVSP